MAEGTAQAGEVMDEPSGAPMCSVETPYHHHEIYTPKTHPFDTAEGLIHPTLAGSFLRPIIEKNPGLIYWFSFYEAHFQFCFAHQDFEKIDREIANQTRDFKTTSKLRNVGSVGKAFRGQRWMEKSKTEDDIQASQRSLLILQFLHSVSSLYVHCLVREGAYWKLEANTHEQNPEGSVFQSLLHLFCNTTAVPTFVELVETLSPDGPFWTIETPFALSHLVPKQPFPVKPLQKVQVHF